MFYTVVSKNFKTLFLPLFTGKQWATIGYLDVVSNYRRTFLDPNWITLSIALQAIAVTYFYSHLFNSSSGSQYYGYVVCGLIAWQWLMAMMTDMGNVFFTHASYIHTTNINKHIFVLGMVWKHGIIFFHNLVLWIFYVLLGAVTININTLAIFISGPLMFVSSIPIVGAMGLLFARYRDLPRLVGSLITLFLILTPIFWQANQLTGPRALLYKMNPLYYLCESIRAPLMGLPIDAHTWIFILGFAIFNWTFVAAFYLRKHRRLCFWI